MSNQYINQKALSESVGWVESTGRGWIKKFKEYIPMSKEGRNKLYNEESVRILTYIKQLNENGLSANQIHEVFSSNGVPGNDKAFNEMLNNHKSLEISFNRDVAETLPSQKELVLPILTALRDGKPYTTSMINDEVETVFNLNESQRNITYSNSRDSIFTTRMRSARYSLKKQEYIEEVSKFTYQITQDGLQLLNDSFDDIVDEIEELENVVDPFEIILDKVQEIETDLINDLIEHLKQAHWRRLETIVVELLTSMGYGDGEVTEKTNDGGLDGIIKEDKLGLDNIYLQAKRWENTVTRPDVMSFSGALDAKGARKGIFITTSSFSKGAEEYTDRLESKKIILIDGRKLAKLMIENNIGVSIKKKLVVKEVDFSYFEGE
ncbi:restriction endonuclease [Pseudalkalibacillus berkeleyi]|uniref:Restriction endonuclease n=1 Tax=Pseudalkalibacillus berkeleyi TaxID=1069813 RepID=A0ABS9H0W5_9BACL|nr:restriction endonuclease [Pseudalkalibacillus berkeleyi]MCF6137716.1 restriction endonuclease [Pseudalkalibacillus berkeleyi]